MATNINVLVSDVLQIISDLRGESSVNTDAARIRAISRANKDFALRRKWKFYLIPNVSVAGSGVSDYEVGSTTYPLRYKGISEVFVSDSSTQQEHERYEVVDYFVFKKRYNENNSDQIAYEWYDKANDKWKIHINPQPEATDTIYYTYFWEPPTLTLTTEFCVCPNSRAIALLASATLHESEDEREIAKEEKNEAEQLIYEIVGDENTPAQNQLYNMGTIETKGYGTY